MLNSSKNIFFMREGNKPEVNTGFFIIKNCELQKTLLFFNNIYDIMMNTPHHKMPLGDQTVINEYKKHIDFDYIPNEYVIWGTVITNKTMCLLHHAINCKDISSKLNQIQEINLLLT
jgi:hypothetical protein